MKLLLDTHIWIWFLLGNERLPPALQIAVVDEANELWLSPISVWETIVLGQKGRVEFEPDPVTWVKKGLKLLDTREARLTNEIAILSRRIELGHEDPADRFLAATALHYGFTLVTVDTRLTGFSWLPVLAY